MAGVISLVVRSDPRHLMLRCGSGEMRPLFLVQRRPTLSVSETGQQLYAFFVFLEKAIICLYFKKKQFYALKQFGAAHLKIEVPTPAVATGV